MLTPTIDQFYRDILLRKCGVPLSQSEAGSEFESFYNAEFVSFILEDASLRHNQKSFMDNLGALPNVYLLARIEVYTILAGAFAKNYDIGSTDGNLKKSQPFKNYHALIKELSDTYNKYGTRLSVKSTPVLLSSKSKNVYKNYVNAPAPTAKIHLVSNTVEAVDIKVVSLSSVDITSMNIYVSDEPIYDLVEPDNINPTSTLLESVPYTTNTYHVLKQPSSKYLGILAKNKYGKQYFLEMDVTFVPPQEPAVTA